MYLLAKEQLDCMSAWNLIITMMRLHGTKELLYNRKGYVMTFDGFGTEENEVVRSLKKAIDMGKLKMLAWLYRFLTRYTPY